MGGKYKSTVAQAYIIIMLCAANTGAEKVALSIMRAFLELSPPVKSVAHVYIVALIIMMVRKANTRAGK